MVTHHIVAREAMWVMTENTLDENGNLSYAMKSPALDGHVEGIEEPTVGVYYECTCGAEFDLFEEAEAHLREVRDSPNGEEVTSMDRLEGDN